MGKSLGTLMGEAMREMSSRLAWGSPSTERWREECEASLDRSRRRRRSLEVRLYRSAGDLAAGTIVAAGLLAIGFVFWVAVAVTFG